MLIAIATYLAIALILEIAIYSFEPSQQIVVVNYISRCIDITVVYTDGSSDSYRVCSDGIIPLSKPIHYVLYSYTWRGIEVETKVYVHHRSWVWITALPVDLYLDRERRHSTVLDSYSVFAKLWKGSPWGLEIMVGTEGAYVEESLAGRLFNEFYGVDKIVATVEDILDRLGIEDRHTRLEIATTALWAAQLVREVKEQEPDLYVNARGLDHIVGIPIGFLLRPIHAIAIHLVRFVDKDTLYRAILHGVKSVEKYIKIFPEWRKVDDASWVEMCRRMERFTLEPKIPSYAHTLLLGALIISFFNTIR